MDTNPKLPANWHSQLLSQLYNTNSIQISPHAATLLPLSQAPLLNTSATLESLMASRLPGAMFPYWMNFNSVAQTALSSTLKPVRQSNSRKPPPTMPFPVNFEQLNNLKIYPAINMNSVEQPTPSTTPCLTQFSPPLTPAEQAVNSTEKAQATSDTAIFDKIAQLEAGCERKLKPIVIHGFRKVMWEDQGVPVYELTVGDHVICRRSDNNMINGTKLLNLVQVSRGIRDSILKRAAGRQVVRIGSISLKGVWLPFEKCLELAETYKISQDLYPLFSRNPDEIVERFSNVNKDQKKKIKKKRPSSPFTNSKKLKTCTRPETPLSFSGEPGWNGMDPFGLVSASLPQNSTHLSPTELELEQTDEFLAL